MVRVLSSFLSATDMAATDDTEQYRLINIERAENVHRGRTHQKLTHNQGDQK